MTKDIEFFKYHGTGNDFIIFDDRKKVFPEKDYALVEHLCHRRFGVGADGLILLRKHHLHDFEMIYFNADGKLGSMCGNGGRCIVSFANSLNFKTDNTHFSFLASDGLHEAKVLSDGRVSLGMNDVDEVFKDENAFVLDTGSPHYVRFVSELELVDVKQEGRAIRNSNNYRENGINVNFVATEGKGIRMATFERGVEDETYSCGTGVVASGISFALKNNLPLGSFSVNVKTRGGQLGMSANKVESEPGNLKFVDIKLFGPATRVFSGSFILK